MVEPTRPVTPQDVLPDGVDGLDVAGVSARKGTIAAFVANAELLDQLAEGTEAYDAVVAQMRELVPTLRAVGLLNVFEPKSELVRAIVAEA